MTSLPTAREPPCNDDDTVQTSNRSACAPIVETIADDDPFVHELFDDAIEMFESLDQGRECTPDAQDDISE